MARKTDDVSVINSIIGPGTFFRGHVELSGLLRIDGDFSGSVKTSGRVIVGQSGRADCAVEAGTVVIGGLFRGEVLASEKVVLLASSVVIGSIIAPRLVAEEGVLLSGRFRITGRSDALAGERLVSRRKELLIESVRRREDTAAADVREPDVPAVQSEHAGAAPPVATAPGGRAWNG